VSLAAHELEKLRAITKQCEVGVIAKRSQIAVALCLCLVECAHGIIEQRSPVVAAIAKELCCQREIASRRDELSGLTG
jgi:hypothetical protein